METLEAICGPLLSKTGGSLKIPGLLVIDTPGHEIFSNLRMRGGSAADIAILLVDVLKGLENQTMESIEILKDRRVPFLVALNKVDMIRGWRKDTVSGKASIALSAALKQQPPEWNDELEERLYNVVGGLSRAGFQAEAFYRIQDFRKQVAIIPVSARYGVGIPELLAVLIGLAQQFLTTKLSQGAGDVSGKSKGIVLELQEEVGMGQTANIILTDGTLHVGDKIVIVKRDGAAQTKVKALFMPKPLDEMRDPRDKFTAVNEVYAAAGVKLVSPDLEGVIPGTTIMTFQDETEFESLKVELEKDLGTLRRRSDNVGVVVKAGSIGGLEALLKMLEDRAIPVRMADIGDISKAEIIEAEAVAERDPYLGAIIGFDVKVLPEAKESAERVQIITSEVIYDAVEGYVQWVAKTKEEDERTALHARDHACEGQGPQGQLLPEERPRGLRRRGPRREAPPQGEADEPEGRGGGRGRADPGEREEHPGGGEGDAGRHLGERPHPGEDDQGGRGPLHLPDQPRREDPEGQVRLHPERGRPAGPRGDSRDSLREGHAVRLLGRGCNSLNNRALGWGLRIGQLQNRR